MALTESCLSTRHKSVTGWILHVGPLNLWLGRMDLADFGWVPPHVCDTRVLQCYSSFKVYR